MKFGNISFIIVIVLGSVLTILFLVLIINSIMKKGKFGINLISVKCPKCGMKVPFIRKPKSRYEIFWGGWTCENCGTKLDKWGRNR